MIKIEVQSTRAVIRYQEPLTVGLRGAKAQFTFGQDWDGLIKTAVFRQGDKTVTVADIGQEVTIPWEVLEIPGVPVQIGVYGIDSTEKIAIPTVWAVTQPVRPGTDPEGDPSTEPTPGLWEQMLGKLGRLEQLDTNDQSSLVAAVNEANRAVFAVTVSGTEGNYSTDCSMTDLLKAWKAGKTLLCLWKEHSQWMSVCRAFVNETGAWTFEFYTAWENQVFFIRLKGMTGTIAVSSTSRTGLATEASKLPNPQKLTFIGAETKEYDGSKEVVVELPKLEVPAPVYPVTISDTNQSEQSFADMLAAHRAGQVLQCDYRGYLLPLKGITDTECTFSGTIDTTSILIMVRSNGKAEIVERSLAKATDIPRNISDLKNDSGYLTKAPVTSVNGQTGDVAVPVPVKVTVIKQPDGSYTADLRTAQIMAAYQSGSAVYCCYEQLVLTLSYATLARCIFTCVYDGRLYIVSVQSSGTTVSDAVLGAGDVSTGITPHIGDNGNWWIGETDTGMPSRGEDAPQEAILYTPQNLTPEQQAQARENIGLDNLPSVGVEEMNMDWKNVFSFTVEEETASVSITIPNEIEKYLYSCPYAYVRFYAAPVSRAEMIGESPKGTMKMKAGPQSGNILVDKEIVPKAFYVGTGSQAYAMTTIFRIRNCSEWRVMDYRIHRANSSVSIEYNQTHGFFYREGVGEHVLTITATDSVIGVGSTFDIYFPMAKRSE